MAAYYDEGIALASEKIKHTNNITHNKTTIFRGNQHPNVIRELTPSWDGHVGSGCK